MSNQKPTAPRHAISDQFPLLDHITSGILAINREANIVLWNNNMEQWTNLSRQHVIGENLFELFPYTAEGTFKTRIHQVLGGGAPVIFSAQLHHHLIPCKQANGEYRAQLVTVTWLKDHQVALFSIQDQSEQLRLIEQYKASTLALTGELNQRKILETKNLQLATAINQAGEAIIITDQHGNFEYTNQAFIKQTGWSEDELKSLFSYDALFDQDESYFDSRINVLFNTAETWAGRKSILRKDGSSFTASISIAPIFDDAGELTHHIVIQEDISQQINMEEKFRHTQKQEALVTLIGGIAHDFNNLLAGLIGQVYLASREVADMPKTLERMKKIQTASQDASEIVKQLLTFARQGEHHAKEFSLKSFINEFVKLAQHSVPESIKLSSTFDPDNINFRGDANQLQQSLLNIIQNAVEACAGVDEPHIEINLSSFHGDEHKNLLKKYPVLRHGHFAHISIRDNGNGIPENILERIFDPFFSTKQLGSGLGLAMVMGCIRHHNGIIDVESWPNRGSCFHLFLPTLSTATSTPERADNTTTRSINILLVDDDERVLEPTKELLECMGHHVTLACDGRVACDIFKQQTEHWDLLITDIVMPHMDGLEASKEMRLLRPDLPVIYATGYDKSLITSDVSSMDNTIIISKPFSPDKLDELINSMVK